MGHYRSEGLSHQVTPGKFDLTIDLTNTGNSDDLLTLPQFEISRQGNDTDMVRRTNQFLKIRNNG